MEKVIFWSDSCYVPKIIQYFLHYYSCEVCLQHSCHWSIGGLKYNSSCACMHSSYMLTFNEEISAFVVKFLLIYW
jgi:hypothetical protein